MLAKTGTNAPYYLAREAPPLLQLPHYYSISQATRGGSTTPAAAPARPRTPPSPHAASAVPTALHRGNLPSPPSPLPSGPRAPVDRAAAPPLHSARRTRTAGRAHDPSAPPGPADPAASAVPTARLAPPDPQLLAPPERAAAMAAPRPAPLLLLVRPPADPTMASPLPSSVAGEPRQPLLPRPPLRRRSLPLGRLVVAPLLRPPPCH